MVKPFIYTLLHMLPGAATAAQAKLGLEQTFTEGCLCTYTKQCEIMGLKTVYSMQHVKTKKFVQLLSWDAGVCLIQNMDQFNTFSLDFNICM